MQKLEGPVLALAAVAVVGAVVALAGPASATEATSLAAAPAGDAGASILEAALGGWTGAPGALLLLVLAGLATAMERVR
jgi:hypothetical protein